MQRRLIQLSMTLAVGLHFWTFSYADEQPKGMIASICERLLSIKRGQAKKTTPIDLSAEERQAINSYTQNGAWDINDALRAEIPIDDPVRCPGCSMLLQALRRFPICSGWVIRRVEMPSEETVAPYLTVNNMVTDLGFMSTSRNYFLPAFMGRASGPRGLFMIIKSRTGRVINSFENEILFEPGTKMRVKFVMPRLNRSHLVILEEVLP